MANYSTKSEKNEKQVKDSVRNESLTKESILVEEDHVCVPLEDDGQPTITCLEGNQEVEQSGGNESLTEGLSLVADQLSLDRSEGAETPFIRCSDDNKQSKDPGMNESQLEASSELQVDHQLYQLDDSLVSEMAATGTAKHKLWSKRSPLCDRMKKGKYNHTQDQCQYLHGQECEICLRPVLHPFRKSQRDTHLQECQAIHTWEAERLEASRSEKCPVCLEIVLEREVEADRRFAILEGCNHACCWRCYGSIKKFHNPNMAFKDWSRCSICRRPYAFAVSSKFLVEDDRNRNRILSEFRKACRHKLCFQFRRTRTCDAGALCIFRHRGQARVPLNLPDIDSDDTDDDGNSDVDVIIAEHRDGYVELHMTYRGTNERVIMRLRADETRNVWTCPVISWAQM